MKICLFILIFNLLFSFKDSFKVDLNNLKLPKINLNIMPVNNADSIMTKVYLEKNEIEAVKIKAKKYEPTPVSDNDIVILETTRGTMKIKLFNQIAPNHCYNFKKLANSGFYDGTSFHRIIRNFIISDGCRLNPNILIHLFAPLTSTPTPGIKTRINSKIPKASNHLSNCSQKVKGIKKTVINRKKPKNR